MNALIVDDELHCRENLSILLRRKCQQIVEIKTASSVKNAIEVMESFNPQVVFLDVRMPGEDGFHLIKHINSSQTCIIFVTAHDEYALRSIKFGPTAYLLKPIDTDELLEAVNQVQQRVELKYNSMPVYNQAISSLADDIAHQKSPEKICLSHSKALQIVPLSEIIYLSSDSYYTTFFLTNSSKIVMSKTLKFYQDILGDEFIRIHRSYLINLSHVRDFKYETGLIRLSTNERLSVSRRKANEVVQRLKMIK